MKSILLLFAFLDFATGATPTISRIVSGGSFTLNKIAAGGYASIFGTSLSDQTYVSVGGAQWPQTLGQTTVMICVSIAVPPAPESCSSPQLLYVSPTQINVLMPQLPIPLPYGASGLGANVYVMTGVGVGQVSSNTLLFALLAGAADIFSVGYECPIDGQAAAGDLPAPGTNCALSSTNSGQPGIMPLRGTITDTMGRLLDSANPAAVGGYYTIWLTGLDLNAPGELLINLQGWQPPLPIPGVGANGLTQVKPTFAGPSPQFPGMSQVNFQIPNTITGAPYNATWPCGSYSWEMSLSIGSTVQIPVKIGLADVLCGQ
jgi:uncharacterized protein (TIGR03437 family)